MIMAKVPSVDGYAARHGRRILLFSYDVKDLPDPKADRRAKRLREILGSPELLAKCEDRFLQGEELAEAKIIRERQAKVGERRKLRDERRAREQERP